MCAEIDEQLAPVVEALWRNGFQTLTSCQDAGKSNAGWVDLLPHMAVYVESRRGWAFIDFPVDSGLAFLTAIAKAGPREAFYVRMTHWAAPDAWAVSVKPYDVAMREETRESQFGLRLMQVCFPVYDLAEILHRLERYEAGDVVAAAPTDWTTVGRARRTALEPAIRSTVRDLFELGPFPAEDVISQEDIEERERRLDRITSPVSDEEARLLVGCFGVDDCYGLAWTLLHLVESAPTFRVDTEPHPEAGEWIWRMWTRYRNSLDQ
jgi:hypothetical protein